MRPILPFTDDRRPLRTRRAPIRATGPFILLAVLSACSGGDRNPGPGPGPTPLPATISSIAPTGGPTTGGTSVTITGGNFVAGATVTIAGVAAQSATVVNASTITAVTGPRAPGTGDVTVTIGNSTATLAAGFTYAVPGPSNNPSPVLTSLVARGTRPNEPVQFADIEEELTVTASVSDAETQPADLIFQWSAESGTISGTGSRVTWRAPRPTTVPTRVPIRLTVIERYAWADGGQTGVRENRIEGAVTVSVHDSMREVSELAVQFLTAFSNSSVAPEVVVSGFSNSCRGKQAELEDTRDNRALYQIDQFTLGTPSVTINFDGRCRFRDRAADACVSVPVRWDVTEKATRRKAGAEGIDYVTAIYEGQRWWLCDSDFDGRSTTTLRFRK